MSSLFSILIISNIIIISIISVSIILITTVPIAVAFIRLVNIDASRFMLFTAAKNENEPMRSQ